MCFFMRACPRPAVSTEPQSDVPIARMALIQAATFLGTKSSDMSQIDRILTTHVGSLPRSEMVADVDRGADRRGRCS